MPYKFLHIVFLCFLMTKAFSQILTLDPTNWHFRDADSSDWMPCKMPGNNYTALLENKAILPPYVGDHEKKLAVLAKKNWQFKHSFQIDSSFLNHEQIELECYGLDTYCDVYLNGNLLGKTDNAFRKYNFPIKNFLTLQLNELIFSFSSAKVIADSLYSLQNPALPGGPRVCTRKPQFHFGWDFGPEFVRCGLSQLPKIITWNKFRIEEAGLHTIQIEENQASLRLQLMLFNSDSVQRDVELSCKIADREFKFNTLLVPGKNVFRNNIEFKNPKLWWPKGSGEAHLYDCSLQLKDSSGHVLAHKKWKTGIRRIELMAETDSIGQSFYFKVNGESIFCKGSNYIPSDILFDSSEKWKSLLNDAAATHFNMLRIWGGGIYECDAFYETCDSLGILVWQDFMFACAMYPGDSAFMKNVAIEAEQQIQRLSKHACIALFCGNNENKEGWYRWGWQSPLDEDSKLRLWSDYQNLFQNLLAEKVQLWAPGISYWDSSPLFGRGDERFKTHGDAHDWGLWHDEMPFSKLESRIPRFMSEFGFQSLPSFACIQEFASESEQHLESPALLNHQKHPRGNKLIKEYIDRDYPKPATFEHLVYINQLCQADGISQIIGAHRRAKPYCMGSLYWQFNDCWPGISWSGIDYLGHWKALQHQLKIAFAPVHFSVVESDQVLKIYGINDSRDFKNFQLDLTIQDFNGSPLYFQSLEDTLKDNSSKLIHIISIDLNELALRESHYLQLKWIVDEDTILNSHFFEKPKNLRLQKPDISIENIGNKNEQCMVTSNTFVRALYLKETKDEVFFPNYFDVHPGIPVLVTRKKSNSNAAILPEFLNLFDIKQ